MISLRVIYFTILCALMQSCVSQIPERYSDYIASSTQVIVVTAKENVSNGILTFYERKSLQDTWKQKMQFPVRIGRNGLATDMQYNATAKKIKQEGDGCSPAGVFSLGPVFSYHKMENLHMAFQQVSKKDLCVDDADSKYYNQLINTDTIANQDWKSFEYMQRDDLQYEYGIWVNYNMDTIIPGNGSCIFLHVWKDEKTGTSGCTAMQKENLLQLINALDAKRNPLLIQYVSD